MYCIRRAPGNREVFPIWSFLVPVIDSTSAGRENDVTRISVALQIIYNAHC